MGLMLRVVAVPFPVLLAPLRGRAPEAVFLLVLGGLLLGRVLLVDEGLRMELPLPQLLVRMATEAVLLAVLPVLLLAVLMVQLQLVLRLVLPSAQAEEQKEQLRLLPEQQVH